MRNHLVSKLRFYGPSRPHRHGPLKEKVMDNLISTVWVIESKDAGVEPIIYLREPQLNPWGDNELKYMFSTPFKAKEFIQSKLGADVKISVTKKTFSQLALVK